MKHRLPVRSLVLFLIACGLAYVLEHYAESFVADGRQHPGVTQSIFNARGVYQYIVASWPRRLVPRYTALVTIEPARDTLAVSFENPCHQRRFLAELIPAIAMHDPAVIVVDKYFTAARCGDVDPSTMALRHAIGEVARRVPVVVGLRIDDDVLPTKHGGRDLYRVVPPLTFVGADRFREGVINTDMDSRRVALGWWIQRAEAAAPEWRRTLALEAAQTYDSDLTRKYLDLEGLVARGEHPYVSVIEREGFRSYFAGDILCGARRPGSSPPSACAQRAADHRHLEYLRGRIVVVGEVSRDVDTHFTVIGHVPGFVLQANYIEALLDERYFKPVPWWVDYAVGFLFFVAIEYALHQSSAVKTIASICGITIFTFLGLSLTVRHLGYYVNPVTVSALVLAVKVIAWLTERIAKRGEVPHAA